MKRKYLSETYLKDVKKYNLKLFIEDDYYLCIKEIKKIEKPFFNNGICLIDNNYYIVEILVKNKHYTIRIFYNEKKEEIIYYYDIVDKIGIDENTNIPYYDDLYLDVIVQKDNIHILDEKELEQALNNKKITINQYNLAKDTISNLLKDIKQKKNIVNIDLKEILKSN